MILYQVPVYYRNDTRQYFWFENKKDALAFHIQVEKEYDDNMRRSDGVVTVDFLAKQNLTRKTLAGFLTKRNCP